MTQMLLFDAAADTSSPVMVPVVPVVATPVSATSVSVVAVSKPAAATRREEGGVTHMGDLARMVLLRYDVVQKRRQDMARRRAK